MSHEHISTSKNFSNSLFLNNSLRNSNVNNNNININNNNNNNNNNFNNSKNINNNCDDDNIENILTHIDLKTYISYLILVICLFLLQFTDSTFKLFLIWTMIIGNIIVLNSHILLVIKVIFIRIYKYLKIKSLSFNLLLLRHYYFMLLFYQQKVML